MERVSFVHSFSLTHSFSFKSLLIPLDPHPQSKPHTRPSFPQLKRFLCHLQPLQRPLHVAQPLHAKFDWAGPGPPARHVRLLQLVTQVFAFALPLGPDATRFKPGHMLFLAVVNALEKAREFDAAWKLVLHHAERDMEAEEEKERSIFVGTFAIMIRRYTHADLIPSDLIHVIGDAHVYHNHVLASRTEIYIILEFITGGELFDKIIRLGCLSEAESRRYFQYLIDSVDYCHCKGVYHRDLKETWMVDFERRKTFGGGDFIDRASEECPLMDEFHIHFIGEHLHLMQVKPLP
ncbi:hypothetical protein JHK84_052882 [Glycine max]|nr:hypothetical protein JHK86_052854 [Glycine max]KAG5082844.1 hypothetical protein JHK84_052882 [Glycine max]